MRCCSQEIWWFCICLHQASCSENHVSSQWENIILSAFTSPVVGLQTHFLPSCRRAHRKKIGFDGRSSQCHSFQTAPRSPGVSKTFSRTVGPQTQIHAGSKLFANWTKNQSSPHKSTPTPTGRLDMQIWHMLLDFSQLPLEDREEKPLHKTFKRCEMPGPSHSSGRTWIHTKWMCGYPSFLYCCLESPKVCSEHEFRSTSYIVSPGLGRVRHVAPCTAFHRPLLAYDKDSHKKRSPPYFAELGCDTSRVMHVLFSCIHGIRACVVVQALHCDTPACFLIDTYVHTWINAWRYDYIRAYTHTCIKLFYFWMYACIHAHI